VGTAGGGLLGVLMPLVQGVVGFVRNDAATMQFIMVSLREGLGLPILGVLVSGGLLGGVLGTLLAAMVVFWRAGGQP
jgi:hypothetical protein